VAIDNPAQIVGLIAAVTYPVATKLRIEPPTSWQGLNLPELWRYRELLYFFVWRDIKVRYKQTVLGALWAVIQPVATTVLFAIFFGRFAGMSRQVDQPYGLFIYVALSLWTFFAGSVTVAANSLVGNSHLISKVYFPRVLIPLSAIITALVDFAVAFVFLLILLALYGVMPAATIVAFPLFVLGTAICAAGTGLTLAALIVSYRDFRYVVGFLTQLWLFATPVLYPLHIVPEPWQLPYALNPMVGMVTGARAAVFGEPFPITVIAISSVSAIVMLAIGIRYFLQVERRFADVI
jgi:homopolymeric O-antigen transport system permease protein